MERRGTPDLPNDERSVDLSAVQDRLTTVQELQWLKRFALPDMLQLIYEDVPLLLEYATSGTYQLREYATSGTNQPLSPPLPQESGRAPKPVYYMRIADTVASRSNCSRRQVGAIVVVTDAIVATGYNGTPRGFTNCFEGGCPRCAEEGESGADLEECLCVHAEQNCVAHAAYHGIRLHGGTMYTMLSPCLTCAKLILNSGIESVVYAIEYTGKGLSLLKERIRCTSLDVALGIEHNEPVRKSTSS
jgi:dCMP deaminase